MHSTVVFFCWKQCFFIDVIKPVKTLSYNKKRKIRHNSMKSVQLRSRRRNEKEKGYLTKVFYPVSMLV